MNKAGEDEYVFTTEGHFFSNKQAYKIGGAPDQQQQPTTSSKSADYKSTLQSLHANLSRKFDSGSSKTADASKSKANKTCIDSPFDKKCELKMSPRKYYNMRHNLPMRMAYFEQLFEAIGV